MAKKKRSKKKKIKTPAPLSVEEERLLDSLLGDLDKIDPNNISEYIKGPDVARNLLERLQPDDPENVQIIMTLRDAFPDREVQKAVRKTVFRFRQKGLQVPDREEEKESPLAFKSYEDTEPSAYISPIDGTGSRGILVMVPQVTKGVDIGLGSVSSEEGIIDFIYGRYSKKNTRELKDMFFRQAGMEIETSISHAATILEHSYRKDVIKAGESAGDYLSLRPWILENISLLERPMIYDFISPEDISDELLTEVRIKKLLDHDLLKSWIIGPDRLQPIIEEIMDTKESRIIISEAQQTDRINEIKEKGLDELYPDSKRTHFKGDLEEMAYVFFRLDQVEYARLCLASASSMDEKSSSIMINPFLRAFLDRSIDYYLDMVNSNDTSEGHAADSSPSIILP